MGRNSLEATKALLMRMARCEGRRLCRALIFEECFPGLWAVLLTLPVPFVLFLDEVALGFELVCLLEEVEEPAVWATRGETGTNPARMAAKREPRKVAARDRPKYFIVSL
jgi:hypothetical protein